MAAAVVVSLAALSAPALSTPSPAASPKLAFATSNQVRVVGADGSNEQPVAWTDEGIPPATWHYLSDPSWSPDGRRIAFGDTFGALWSPINAELHIARADGGSDDIILDLPAAGIIEHVRWSPAGDKLAFVLWTPNPPAAVATWTRLGSRWDIYVVNVDGSGLRPVAPAHASFQMSFDFSPDGAQIAFVTDQEGAFGVFTVPVEGVAVPTRVSPKEVLAEFPRWSPDGSRIAFLGTPIVPPGEILGLPRIWTVGATGADARALPATTYHPPTWSPDSRTIAFACLEGCGLASIAIDGTSHRVLTTNFGQDYWPLWSRHGKIAFVREEGRACCTRNLWVMDGDGTNQRRVSAAGSVTFAIAWSQ